MSDKQFLDYEGLQRYHNKQKLNQSKPGQNVGDRVKDLYNLEGTVTNDDVFTNIWYRLQMIASNNALITLRLTLQDGSPLGGFSVPGILDASENPAVSNENGVIIGYVEEGTKTLSFPDYADLSAMSKEYTFVKGESYSDEWVLEPIEFLTLTATKNVQFSNRVSLVEYSVIGGGGGGASGSDGYGGGGGGGGYSQSGTLTPIADTPYQCKVGSGGSAGKAPSSTGRLGKSGGNGGTSTFNGISASGGNGGVTRNANAGSYVSPTGGTGNGNGGNGAGADGSTKPATSGGNATTTYYSSFVDTSLCGGGGGGGSNRSATFSGSGGSPNGGTGGSVGGNGTSAKGPGGGGGGGSSYVYASETDTTYTTGNGGAGYGGMITFRIYTD